MNVHSVFTSLPPNYVSPQVWFLFLDLTALASSWPFSQWKFSFCFFFCWTNFSCVLRGHIDSFQWITDTDHIKLISYLPVVTNSHLTQSAPFAPCDEPTLNTSSSPRGPTATRFDHSTAVTHRLFFHLITTSIIRPFPAFLKEDRFQMLWRWNFLHFDEWSVSKCHQLVEKAYS